MHQYNSSMHKSLNVLNEFKHIQMDTFHLINVIFFLFLL